MQIVGWNGGTLCGAGVLGTITVTDNGIRPFAQGYHIADIAPARTLRAKWRGQCFSQARILATLPSWPRAAEDRPKWRIKR